MPGLGQKGCQRAMADPQGSESGPKMEGGDVPPFAQDGAITQHITQRARVLLAGWRMICSSTKFTMLSAIEPEVIAVRQPIAL